LSEGETLPDEFVLIDGSRLAIGGTEVIDTHNIDYASARRLGRELCIKTGLGRSKKLL
jgi:hypothetical protein